MSLPALLACGFALVIAGPTIAMVSGATPAAAVRGGARATTVITVPTKPDPARVERDLRTAWERLETVVERFNHGRDDLAKTRAKSTALMARLRPLRAAVDEREARVGGLAARAYRTSGVAEVSALLAATSPEQFADRLLLVRRLTSQRSRAVDGLKLAQARYESAHQVLTELAAEQRRQQESLASQRRRIEAQIRTLSGKRARWSNAGGGRSRPRDGYVPAYASGPAGTALRFAYRQLDKPYQWGGSGPAGYDCSGLTSAAWRAAGVRLPHNAAQQWHTIAPISRAELRQGDLVFYYGDIHHVALYVGADRVIHAPTQGERIRVERMRYAPIYGYGRVHSPSGLR